jgi:hypothetical protein
MLAVLSNRDPSSIANIVVPTRLVRRACSSLVRCVKRDKGVDTGLMGKVTCEACGAAES